jgi:hypothetical protein
LSRQGTKRTHFVYSRNKNVASEEKVSSTHGKIMTNMGTRIVGLKKQITYTLGTKL